MTTREDQEARSKSLLSFFFALLSSDFVALLPTLWQLGRRILTFKAHEGMYEVIELDARLELRDAGGRHTVLHKHEKVRFLQDNIIAYQDKAWGDGDIFADYKCSPGVAVDRYQDGHRYRILISLRETKNRGDIQVFHTERTIRNGFTGQHENFQMDIDHTTRKLSMSVVFPANRLPSEVALLQQNTTRSVPLGPEYRHILPDGRQQVSWSTDKPKIFEAYILSWKW
jgi:hypothetical protein